MMYVHRCIGVALATLGVAFGGLLLASAPALATGPYTYEKALEQPSEPSQLGLGMGPNGELFAANLSSKVVDVYEPGATPKEIVAEFTVASASGALYKLAVADATATASKVDVYVANLGGSVIEYEYDPETKVATQIGEITEELNEPASVAVGPEGDVYVGSFAGGAAKGGYVNKYSSTGALITKELIKELTTPESLAVDSSGNIYVASGPGALKCSNTGTCVAFGGAEVAKPDDGVAIGPEGDVYISVEAAAPSTNYIFVYSTSGTLVEEFGSDHVVNTPYGLAVGSSHAYVASNGEVSAFKGKAPTGEPLTIKKTGTGQGTVTCEVNSGGAFETCASVYPKGTKVTIKGTPAAGSGFEGWSAGPGSAASCTGTSPCTFTLEAASEVTATFTKIPLPKHALEVEVKGNGAVTSGGTINCKEGGSAGECSEEIEETAPVELKAAAASGWKLKEWKGVSCEGGSNTTPICKFPMPNAATKVEVVLEETHAQPLTVFVTGEGKVTGGNGIACSTGDTGTCTESLEGTVTLTGEAGPGYVLAGWIGCEKTGAMTCEVEVTAAREVIAVFLKEGTQGAAGTNGTDGTNGTNGTNGEKGGPGGKGATGATGTAGEKGSTGANGAEGPTGANGAAGPAGPAGPAGQIELVTCKKAGKRQKCTTKLVSGTVKFTGTGSSAHATLSHHGAVYAAGTESSASGGMSLRLTPLRKLRPGHYTLTLISGAGKHETIRSESFTLS